MHIILIFSALFTGGALLLLNRDLLSPSKLLMIKVCFFSGAVFLGDESQLVELTILIFILICFLLGVIENLCLRNKWAKKPTRVIIKEYESSNTSKAIWFLWAVSVLPIFCQLYMIQAFGGVISYVATLELRVLAFQGYGPFLFVISLLKWINLVYFCVVVTKQKLTKLDFSLYTLHLSLVVLVGLLGASRGATLIGIVLLIMAFHYCRKNISLKFGLSALLLLTLTVSVMEVARNDIDNIGDYSISEKGLGNKFLSYSTLPLDLIYEQGVHQKHYGMTFMTLFTNFIPRKIWPDKPDTGGVVLTNEYTLGWGGLSNLSTGLFAESYINFGFTLGAMFATAIVFIIYIPFILFYKNHVFIGTNQLNSNLKVAPFVMMSFSFSSLFVGEFTNLFLSLGLNLLFLKGLSYMVIRISSQSENKKNIY